MTMTCIMTSGSNSNSPTESTINTSALSKGQSDASGSITQIVSKPSTPSEWQLYTVLQRANLIQYYDTFISQGGDDVHQLLEAGEEELLEIMALVGMASKPLHVRRLQKALHEYARHGPLQSLMSPSGKTKPSLSTIIPTKLSTTTNFESSPAKTAGWMQNVDSGANEQPGIYPGSLFQPSGADNFTTNHFTENESSLFPGEHYSTAAGSSPSFSTAQIDKGVECAEGGVMEIAEVDSNNNEMCRDVVVVMEMTPDLTHRMNETRRSILRQQYYTNSTSPDSLPLPLFPYDSLQCNDQGLRKLEWLRMFHRKERVGNELTYEVFSCDDATL